ncbi:F510_1955 family glycosylhydrolase [Arthrobacter sp. BPSS-3]|uniref:F510_1955 family glycosylhydrolase n=1 Tax=Arthrobacter sp. BPSS-3 TaxID=3366580 RepID=UPI0037DC56B6
MSVLRKPRKRPTAMVSAAAAITFLLPACSPAPPSTPISVSPLNNALPDAHVHGLSADPASGQLLLATHEGLFDVTSSAAVKIGPTNDLMGYATAGERGVLFASGHPGPGTAAPDPLGLIKSTDGGKTWQPLSRQGESDFHALTVTGSGLVAFDGTLRTSTDGTSWKAVGVDFHPAALAGHPGSGIVLATAQDGLRRSTDAGATWTKVPGSPVIQFATFASVQTAVGAAPDGAVYRSDDGGATWKAAGKPTGPVQAVAANQSSDGKLRIWVATAQGLEVSADGGQTFSAYDPAGAGPGSTAVTR